MEARYTAKGDGSEARIELQPNTPLDVQLLKVLTHKCAVVSLRCKAGTANLLEFRIVLNGVDYWK